MAKVHWKFCLMDLDFYVLPMATYLAGPDEPLCVTQSN